MVTHTSPNGNEPRPAFRKESADALILLDEQRHVLWMNPAAEQLTGQKSDDVSSVRYCHELFQCRDERGERLAGHNCPGYEGFLRHAPHTAAEYTITRNDGESVRVTSEYRIVQQPNRVGLAMLRMRPARAKPAVADRVGFGAAAMTGFGVLAALLYVIAVTARVTGYEWKDLGRLEAAATGEPSAMAFKYPSAASPVGLTRGVAYVSAPPGRAIAAVEAMCPYEGALVNWNESWGIFVCPIDGSFFDPSGQFISGKAAGTSLRKLDAELDGQRVRVRLPRLPMVPLKDRPAVPEPMFYGP